MQFKQEGNQHGHHMFCMFRKCLSLAFLAASIFCVQSYDPAFTHIFGPSVLGVKNISKQSQEAEELPITY